MLTTHAETIQREDLRPVMEDLRQEREEEEERSRANVLERENLGSRDSARLYQPQPGLSQAVSASAGTLQTKTPNQ